MERTALSSISERNTGASTPAIRKRVAFDVVASPDSFSCRTPHYKATCLRTPPGVILPGESLLSSLSSPGDFVSPRKHVKSCSVYTPGNTPITPSGLMSQTVDGSCEGALSFLPHTVKMQQTTHLN